MADCVVLVYHKNAGTLYQKEWLDQFVNSIESQTYSNFDILEINYGGSGERLFSSPGSTSAFYSGHYDNFVQALNFLIKEAISRGYKYIFNTNCDDIYSPMWLEKQLPILQNGYDIVSCNFSLFRDNKDFHTHSFHNLDIRRELSKNHNIICHPAVGYNSSFFNDFQYIPEEIPREDLLLWQRAISTKKFYIHPEILLRQRIHVNNLSREGMPR